MKRHPEAEEQIAEARGPVETPDLDGEMPPVILDGEQRDAYAAFAVATKRASVAQSEIAAANDELRAAIARLCKVVAG